MIITAKANVIIALSWQYFIFFHIDCFIADSKRLNGLLGAIWSYYVNINNKKHSGPRYRSTYYIRHLEASRAFYYDE